MVVALGHRKTHHGCNMVRPSVLWAEQQIRAFGMKKLRCAIYTRKSSEDGLEQEFNSLDAQREACAS